MKTIILLSLFFSFCFAKTKAQDTLSTNDQGELLVIGHVQDDQELLYKLFANGLMRKNTNTNQITFH